jgi:hypothetical protein
VVTVVVLVQLQSELVSVLSVGGIACTLQCGWKRMEALFDAFLENLTLPSSSSSPCSLPQESLYPCLVRGGTLSGSGLLW